MLRERTHAGNDHIKCLTCRRSSVVGQTWCIMNVYTLLIDHSKASGVSIGFDHMFSSSLLDQHSCLMNVCSYFRLNKR